MDQFPIDLTYEKSNSESYMVPLSSDILQNESPFTILGKCSYTATYISVHSSDPFCIASLATELIPEYHTMEVKVAYPLPIQFHRTEKKCKPAAIVHAITLKQFQHLLHSLTPAPMRRHRLATHPVPAERYFKKWAIQGEMHRSYNARLPSLNPLGPVSMMLLLIPILYVAV